MEVHSLQEVVIVTSHAPDSPTPVQSAHDTNGRAVTIRRWFLITSPVLAGLFVIIGAATDPAAGIEGRELYQLYADNPDPLQFHTLGLHWAFAFFGVPALFVAAYVRGRGAWLANVAAVMGFIGISTLPGLLFIDFYDSAIGELYGADGAVAVTDKMDSMWGVAAFAAPAAPGLILGFLLAIAALWRAGLVPWWAFAAGLAGCVALYGSGVRWWGAVAMTVLFTVVAVALAEATRVRTPQP